MDSRGSGFDVIVVALDDSRRFFPENPWLIVAFANNTGKV